MNEFVCAGIANTVQMIIGYPLDTAKIWAQTNTKQQYTIKNLYSGIKYPLIGQGAMTALCFSTYDYGIKQSYGSVGSAFLSGSLISLIIVPFEVSKIVKQYEPKTNKLPLGNLYLKCLFPVYSRETIYITMFLNLQKYFKDETDLSPSVYGGICSSLSWIITYPLDKYKTKSILLHSLGKKINDPKLFDVGLAYSLFRVSLGGSIFMSVYSKLLITFRKS
jgi:hypothetical protein